MTCQEAAAVLSRPGVRVMYLGDDRLDIRGINPELLRHLAPHKWHLLACLILHDIPDPEQREHLRYRYEERAVVYQYDAGQTRTDAERLALSELRAALKPRNPLLKKRLDGDARFLGRPPADAGADE